MEPNIVHLQHRIAELENQIAFLQMQDEDNSLHNNQFENELRLLNQSFSEMMQITNLEVLYKYIASNLQKQIPDTIVLFNSINEQDCTSKLEVVAGLENNFLIKIIEIAGINPIGKVYNLLPNHNDYFRSGELVEFKGNLAEFSASEFPAIAARTIEKLIGLNKIYTIGILKGRELLASIHLITFGNKEIRDSAFVKAFVNQAGIIIQKVMIENTLKESEREYRTIVDDLLIGIVVHDSNGNIVISNKAASNILGLTPDQLRGKETLDPYWKFVNEDMATVDIKDYPVSKVLSTKKPLNNYVLGIARPDRDYITWGNVNAVPLFSADNSRLERVIVNFIEITEQKQTYDSLKQVRQNFETFFNNVDDFLFVLDNQANIVHINNRVTERLGYTKDELIGRSVLSLHPTDRLEEAKRIVGEMLIGIEGHCSVPLLTKDGVQIPVESKVNHGFWNGNPAIFGVSKDITQVKLSEEKFSKVFYLNPSACGLTDLYTGKYIEVNDAFYSLLGYDKEEVIGKTPLELGILTESEIISVEMIAKKIGCTKNIESKLNAKNGSIKNVLLSAEIIQIQDKQYRYTVVHDITDRKRVEAELLERELNFMGLFDTVKHAIYIQNPDSTFINVNQGAVEMYGYEREFFIGKTPDVLSAPGKNDIIYVNQLAKLAFNGEPQKFEFWGIKKDGTIFPKDVWTIKGKYFGKDVLITLANDITERKINEQELINSKEKAIESDRLKTAFLQNISHEIRTPLNGIIGFSKLISIDDNTKEEILEYAEIIKSSGNRLIETINNVIDISMLETGQMRLNVELISVNSVIYDLFDLFKKQLSGKSIILKYFVGLSDEDSYAHLDYGKLNKILSNLLSNAVKFTNNGEIEFGYIIENDRLKFSVRDTGKGIPLSHQSRIFDRFWQGDTSISRSYEGSGLGLSICSELCLFLDGEIHFDSTEHSGTIFYIYLPLNK